MALEDFLLTLEALLLCLLGSTEEAEDDAGKADCLNLYCCRACVDRLCILCCSGGERIGS